MTRTSASTVRASRAAPRSLSITASTPRSEPSRLAHDRDPAAAVGDDDEAVGDQRLHGGRVEDLQRLGRGDHAAPALLAAVLPGLAVLDQQERLVGRQEAADRLGRLLRSRGRRASTRVRVTTAAVRRDRPRPRSAASRAFISTKPSVAWVCAPHQSSGTGGTDGRGQLVLDQQVADLRPVAVGDHDVDVVARAGPRRPPSPPARRRSGPPAGPAVRVGHRVAAQREQDPHRVATPGVAASSWCSSRISSSSSGAGPSTGDAGRDLLDRQRPHRAGRHAPLGPPRRPAAPTRRRRRSGRAPSSRARPSTSGSARPRCRRWRRRAPRRVRWLADHLRDLELGVPGLVAVLDPVAVLEPDLARRRRPARDPNGSSPSSSPSRASSTQRRRCARSVSDRPITAT